MKRTGVKSCLVINIDLLITNQDATPILLLIGKERFPDGDCCSEGSGNGAFGDTP